MENWPTMEDLDTEPTVEEFRKAITGMASGKAPGSDGISADLFRQRKSYLLPLLHDILIKCWREGRVPQDMRDAKIITLYKNKSPYRIAITTVELSCLVLLAKFLHV